MIGGLDEMNIMILLPIVLPVIVGFVLLFLPERVFKSRQSLLNVTGVSFIVCALLALYVISGAAGDRLVLFDLVGSIPVYFAIDSLGRLFAIGYLKGLIEMEKKVK